ncbi:hypothetical protein ACTHGU_21295 [Chitinophagaceae bacterium MMS25-I14]
MARNVLVNLSKNMAKNLLKEYRQREEELEQKIADLQIELQEIKEITENIVLQLDTQASYDPAWPRWSKVEFALQNINKLSTVAAIIDELRHYEIDLQAAPFHATLSQKVDNNSIFFRYASKTSGSEYLYGLREWLDSDGRIANKYLRDNIRSKNNEIELSDIFIK